MLKLQYKIAYFTNLVKLVALVCYLQKDLLMQAHICTLCILYFVVAGASCKRLRLRQRLQIFSCTLLTVNISCFSLSCKTSNLPLVAFQIWNFQFIFSFNSQNWFIHSLRLHDSFLLPTTLLSFAVANQIVI